MSHWFEQIPASRAAQRRLGDRLVSVAISAGGAGVLMTVLLLFFFLCYEVLPLFQRVELAPLPERKLRVEAVEPVYMLPAPTGAPGWLVDRLGQGYVIDPVNDQLLLGERLADATVTALSEQGGLLALGTANGEVILLKPAEGRMPATTGGAARQPETVARITLGTAPLQGLSVSRHRGRVTIVARSAAGGSLLAARLQRDERTGRWRRQSLDLSHIDVGPGVFHVGGEGRWLYSLQAEGGYQLVELGNEDQRARVVDSGVLFEAEDGAAATVTSSRLLLGGLSLVAASDRGELARFMVVRGPGKGARLQRVGDFDTAGEVVVQLIPEKRRKSFVALGRTGRLQVYYSSSRRPLYTGSIGTGPRAADLFALSADAGRLAYLAGDGVMRSWLIDNPHPEVSWSALWGKLWYESYDKPAYIWQSSATEADFEPKYSFAPLTFGTLKAAVYTMLLAAPLAICGAIYTAYFMAPALRRKVKPVIELMEALPTVILGFLAGLWLAPLLEQHLAALLVLLLTLPLAIVAFGFLLSRLPLNRRLVEGWTPLLLIPLVIAVTWVCFSLNEAIQASLFDGDMRLWIQRELGLPFDQRNALVIGVAMGMAVIPSVFSIAEDALFSVPKHLGDGALALGATRWQALATVVLPTASPGMFSALMIGTGRAVGETMIVLMATGNTPIIDANLFEGMRTLAANIAIEIPEAEVGGTHYRVLILSAFVLFVMTFAFNTLAEVVRQRLRARYGAL